MTREELAAIKAVADAATPGLYADGGLVYTGQGMNAIDCYGAPNAENNAAFIAAARTAVPALLAEVERLRGSFEAMAAWGRIEGYMAKWAVAHVLAGGRLPDDKDEADDMESDARKALGDA